MAILKTKVSPNLAGLQLKEIPHAPGIYLFRDSSHTIIYVGKAIDLHRRVSSYFDKTHEDTKTGILVSQVHSVEVIQTKSEFEALLLEAKYIRTLQPKYNILARDDKSPLYILIDQTVELPVITLTRKPKRDESTPIDSEPVHGKKSYFGPFSSKKITEDIMRSIRKIIPYCTQKIRTGRPCFYTHLGLCDPCPSKITGLPDGALKTEEKNRYKKHMKSIIRILSGKSGLVLTDMQKEMNRLSRQKKYEEAEKVKRQFYSLLRMIQTTYEPFSFENVSQASGTEELDDLQQILVRFYPDLKALSRIECFDIATLFGSQTVASMVTFVSGIQDRSSYRKFRIRSITGISDTDAMRETLSRRLNHSEWPYPDLIIVDGGKPQVSAAQTVLSEAHVSIPLIGLAKREEQIVIPINDTYKVISIPLSRPSMNLLRRIRDEAHRFVNAYHRRSRRNETIPPKRH